MYTKKVIVSWPMLKEMYPLLQAVKKLTKY